MESQPRPIYTDPDKRRSLDELAAMTPKGAVVAVGGGLSSREPMAAAARVLRRGVSGLTVVGSAHGIDIDLLCGGGALARRRRKLCRLRAGFRHGTQLSPRPRVGRGQGR